jgi:hypothetical protein
MVTLTGVFAVRLSLRERIEVRANANAAPKAFGAFAEHPGSPVIFVYELIARFRVLPPPRPRRGLPFTRSRLETVSKMDL